MMSDLKSPASLHAAKRPMFWTRLPNTLLLCIGIGLMITSPAVKATTLYKCKVNGKTVYSDTDCPRETRIKKDAKPAKPRVVKIRQSVASTKSR